MQKKKILFLFYRSPIDNKTSSNKRQNLIYSTLKKNYEAKILTFGNKDELTENQQVVRLKKSNFTKIINFLLRLQSPRLTHYKSEKFKNLLKENLIFLKQRNYKRF